LLQDVFYTPKIEQRNHAEWQRNTRRNPYPHLATANVLVQLMFSGAFPTRENSFIH